MIWVLLNVKLKNLTSGNDGLFSAVIVSPSFFPVQTIFDALVNDDRFSDFKRKLNV